VRCNNSSDGPSQCCSVLQCVAVCCSVPATSNRTQLETDDFSIISSFRILSRQHTTTQNTAKHCKTLQHTATHCNTLQHTATHSTPPGLNLATYIPYASTEQSKHNTDGDSITPIRTGVQRKGSLIEALKTKFGAKIFRSIELARLDHRPCRLTFSRNVTVSQVCVKPWSQVIEETHV